MSLEKFMEKAVSSWMKEEGPEGDIVLSTRVRLARNIEHLPFPLKGDEEANDRLLHQVKYTVSNDNPFTLEMVKMNELQPLQKRVLVEKHLISPNLADHSKAGAVLLSDEEDISIMINEEDHLRIQCLYPGLQLESALEKANKIDDWLEGHLDFAFDENRGYLTSCPTNVGTGLRASVMVHLPGLVMTQQMNRVITAINQLGLVVRGIYGEGSEALGNIFQISNQLTLGKSETEIVEDLRGVVNQIIEREHQARKSIMEVSPLKLEDRVYRSYGILTNSRIMDSKEAAKYLSDLRLGIDLDLITNISRNVLNELMVLTQVGFIQQFSGEVLSPGERDSKRATIIRERLKLEKE
ncbi:ATP:guanido phosphotransferase [Bacillus coahuilensis m2-6]|uniref:protein arginine kinase n=1 Tax=Bacillus coahuilensis TaxID=408580 RepID=UPI0007504DE8|nr:protein arginine kinase [Bacillus coahuilensis]KUP04595.1 ATP:guanido phosphotransferase [Bacillus coahuilensis m2-6]